MATISGGEKMAIALATMAANLKKAGTLRVGFLENATYPDGKSVAMIAAIQNFGAPSVGIPPRPFFSNMIRSKRAAWPRALAINLRAADYDAQVALRRFGTGVAGQLRQSIKDTNSPPLAPSTIAKRMRGMTGAQIAAADKRAAKTGKPPSYAKPLVDTGIMLGSVDYEVE